LGEVVGGRTFAGGFVGGEEDGGGVGGAEVEVYSG